MHSFRTASVLVGTLLVVLLSVPAHAGAAAAPVLKSPEASASAAVEGASMGFEWVGALQGDPTTLDRSFFRLEIIKSSDMPAGAQSEWPAAKVENSFQTTPGEAETTAAVGVPTAGEYRWRVCAWGVDDVVANVIIQLPGGCSATRSFTTVTAATTNHSIGELKMEETTNVAGETRVVEVKRPAQASPPPVNDESVVETAPPVEELPPAKFTNVPKTGTEGGGNSALGLGTGGFKADAAASREGLGGAIMGGLSSTLPLVPIPFWTLALLLACFPILRVWRRSVLGMFEWDDGSIDGRGTFVELHDDLGNVPLAQEVKIVSMTADGTAVAPATVANNPLAPDWGRHAA